MNKKASKKTSGTGSKTIALNKKAKHDYFIEDTFEAGLVLQGWEVKSLRDGRGQITESYVLLKEGEAWLIGAQITPLSTVSTHIHPDPTRSRKLLLHQRELGKLFGAVARQGYTVVALALYWKGPHVKVEIGMAKGKKQHDKRATIKQRDWDREKQKILKRG